MGRIKKHEPRICPKCGKIMDTRRNDAKQCRKCRRKQQSDTGNKINIERQQIISDNKLKEKSLKKIKPFLIERFSDELDNPELYKKENTDLLLDIFQNSEDYFIIDYLGRTKKDIIKEKKEEFKDIIEAVKRHSSTSS